MKVLRTLKAAIAIALLSACGGGGGTVPLPTTFVDQTSGLSAYPISNNRVVLSPTGGYTGGVTLPNVTSGAGAIVRIGAQTTPPAGIATLASDMRSLASARRLASARAPLLYVVFIPDRNTVLAAHPGFDITLPQPPTTGTSYYVAALNDLTNQWALLLEGPAAISGSTLTFPAAVASVPWDANQPYWYAVYASTTAATLSCSTVTASNGQTYSVAHLGGGDNIDVESSAYANCDIGIYISEANGPAHLDHTVVNGPFQVGIFVDASDPLSIDHTSICVNGSNSDGTCALGSNGSSGIGLGVQSTPNITIDHTNIDGYAAGLATSPCPNPANNISDNHTTITNAANPWSFAGGTLNVVNASPVPSTTNNTCTLTGVATTVLH